MKIKSLVCCFLILICCCSCLSILSSLENIETNNESLDYSEFTWASVSDNGDYQHITEEAVENYLKNYGPNTKFYNSEHFKTVISLKEKSVQNKEKSIQKKQNEEEAFIRFINKYCDKELTEYKYFNVEQGKDEFGDLNGTALITSNKHTGTFSSNRTGVNNEFCTWYLQIDDKGLSFTINEKDISKNLSNVLYDSDKFTVKIKGSLGIFEYSADIISNESKYNTVSLKELVNFPSELYFTLYFLSANGDMNSLLGLNKSIVNQYLQCLCACGLVLTSTPTKIVIQNEYGTYNLGELSSEEIDELKSILLNYNQIIEIAKKGKTNLSEAKKMYEEYKNAYSAWYELAKMDTVFFPTEDNSINEIDNKPTEIQAENKPTIRNTSDETIEQNQPVSTIISENKNSFDADNTKIFANNNLNRIEPASSPSTQATNPTQTSYEIQEASATQIKTLYLIAKGGTYKHFSGSSTITNLYTYFVFYEDNLVFDYNCYLSDSSFGTIEKNNDGSFTIKPNSQSNNFCTVLVEYDKNLLALNWKLDNEAQAQSVPAILSSKDCNIFLKNSFSDHIYENGENIVNSGQKYFVLYKGNLITDYECSLSDSSCGFVYINTDGSFTTVANNSFNGVCQIIVEYNDEIFIMNWKYQN